MNVKKALPIFVIVSMMIALIPSIMFANATGFTTVQNTSAGTPAIVPPAVTSGIKGDTIVVKGNGEPPGTTVQLYWDDVTHTWNGINGLVNSTTVASDGTYNVWFNVPEATNGSHSITIKDSAGNFYSDGFTVTSTISLSSSSGLAGDSVALKLYGFSGLMDVKIVYNNGVPAVPGWTPIVTIGAPYEAFSTGDGSTTSFSGTLKNALVKPGTLTVYVGGAAVGTDNLADGSINGATISSGSINYITGAVAVVFTTPGTPANTAPITIGYSYYTLATPLYSLTHVSTNSLGSVSVSVTIPSGLANPSIGAIEALDGDGVTYSAAFSVGPTISITPTLSVTGAIVHILGRGFTYGDTFHYGDVVLSEPGMTDQVMTIYNPSHYPTADINGRFSFDVVVPNGKNIKDDYTITVTAHGVPARHASADFQITAQPTVSVTPSFAAQGNKVTVSGTDYERVSGITVTVDLDLNGVYVANFGTTKTASDGTFSSQFTVPLQTSGSYKINAYIANATLSDTVSFTIGNVIIALADSSGPVGWHTTLTGSGFSTNPVGTFNVSIGTGSTWTTLVSSGTVQAGGVLPATDLTIPTLAPGTYTVQVFDVAAGIPVTTSFTVTYGTSISLSSTTFPSGFNVTISGKGFDAVGGWTPNFVLYNLTSSGVVGNWWTMDVKNATWPTPGTAVITGTSGNTGSGNLLGWWVASPSSTTLSPGKYYINATDNSPSAFMATTSFVIGATHVVATPRKATFGAGDTISFQLEDSFGNDPTGVVYGSNLKIMDPSGSVLFQGDALKTWVKTGDWYTAPYSSQTAGGNPMTLDTDAATGMYTFSWIGTDNSLIASGSFNVTAAASSQTNAQITALAAQVASVANSVTSLGTTVGNVATTANAASSAATAASTAASAAKTSADAATTAATTAGTKADAATAAATAAETAANNAASSANNLTTLVYGAIGASLVAALAAIVALMQISRKIA